ncbi:MAG TPA: hypothetical protein VGN56_00280 [Candidatus Paceibacterota bacterium]|jgi:general stress protein CsbA|nr:hypothetical protein [Candidatus Paceibacterota bacterium]
MADIDSQKRRAHTAPRLHTRQRMFQAIAGILLLFILYELYIGTIRWWLALIAIAIGLVLGFIMGRLVRVRWDDEAQRVVTQMDVIGVIVIVAYIAVAFLRNYLLGQWLTGAALTAASLSLAAGLLYGRYLGMRRSIQKVISANAPL